MFGRSYIFSCFLSSFLCSSIGQWKTSVTGPTGSFIEVELVLKGKKVGKPGGMRNWYELYFDKNVVIDLHY